MNEKNFPDDINSKSLNELTKLANEIIDNLENEKNLENSINDYQKLYDYYLSFNYFFYNYKLIYLFNNYF